MSLLEQVRRVRNILAKDETTAGLDVVVAELGAIFRSNVYLVANDGTIAAAYGGRGPDCTGGRPGKELNPQFQQRMAFIFQPVVNLPLETCLFMEEGDCYPPDLLVAIYPLQLSREKLGNLLLTRRGEKYSEEEQVLLEMAALVAAVGWTGNTGGEGGQNTLAKVKTALDSLSYSELVAMRNVFQELGGEEGFLVASKVADRIGITRSVIVNAMRKLESAGVVESRSLGMKGTYIKVKNPDFLAELGRKEK